MQFNRCLNLKVWVVWKLFILGGDIRKSLHNLQLLQLTLPTGELLSTLDESSLLCTSMFWIVGLDLYEVNRLSGLTI